MAKGEVLLVAREATASLQALSEALAAAASSPFRSILGEDQAYALLKEADGFLCLVDTLGDVEMSARLCRSRLQLPVVLLMATPNPRVWDQAAQVCGASLVDLQGGPRQIVSAFQGAWEACLEARMRLLPLEQACFIRPFHSGGQARLAQQLAGLPLAPGPILIEAERGCGGSFLARWLHFQRRRRGAFLPLDCGQSDTGELDRLLFGGAGRRPGLLERARGGTLFLRDPHLLPKELQDGLWAWLRQQAAAGAEAGREAVELVLLGSVNLARQVERGAFHRGLSVSLSLCSLRLPPLRDQDGEIPVLAAGWCARLAEGCCLSPEAAQVLKGLSLPGNAVELHQVLSAAVAAAGPLGTVLPCHLPPACQPRRSPEAAAPPGDQPLREPLVLLPEPPRNADLPDLRLFRTMTLNQAERIYLQRALDQAGGKVTRALELAGVSRSTFYALMAKHGLGPARPDPPVPAL